MTAIVDITVTGGNTPAGYSLIPVNLNAGTGASSANLYFAVATSAITPDTNYICGVSLVAGSSASITTPEGYSTIYTDLNAGAGGQYVYFSRRYLQNSPPITGFKVTASSKQADALVSPGPGYIMLPVDINAGAGGQFIYAWYKKMSDDEYCSITTVLGRPYCANYCTNGKCDTAMTAYCKTSKGSVDPRCSCINSAATDPSVGINPKCIDGKCLSTGYLTNNMIQTNCPNVINCNQQVSIKTMGIQLRSDVNVSSDCGNETPSTSNTTDMDTSTSGVKYNTNLLLFLILIFIMIACGVGYLWMDSNDSEITFEQIPIE